MITGTRKEVRLMKLRIVIIVETVKFIAKHLLK